MHLSRFIAPLIATLLVSTVAQAAEDYSEAERDLFIANQLSTLQPPATLRYSYRKSGSLEEGFDDTVTVTLSKQADGGCCAASAQFLTGARQVRLPDLESAQGNPVILYFLERDIHEMQRLTKGQHNYFRKRIRMAVYQGASIRTVTVPYRGGQVAGKEITISPYVDDPLRARYEKLANKQYVFTLSDSVPGGVYAMRSRIAGESTEAEPLILEEMQVDGVAATGPAPGASAPRKP
jgi:hypothetical protein